MRLFDEFFLSHREQAEERRRTTAVIRRPIKLQVN